jgi:hypothetical protein
LHGAGSGKDGSKTEAVSIEQLQSLEHANARLRTLVAELLLKNQTLRWKLADDRSPDMQRSSVSQTNPLT